ncbi:MAG: hypothetical protein ACRCXZ_09655 [Patescibacteria group bacterium]
MLAFNPKFQIETFIVDLGSTGLATGRRKPHLTWSKGVGVKSTKSNLILTNPFPDTQIDHFDSPLTINVVSDFAPI